MKPTDIILMFLGAKESFRYLEANFNFNFQKKAVFFVSVLNFLEYCKRKAPTKLFKSIF